MAKRKIDFTKATVPDVDSISELFFENTQPFNDRNFNYKYYGGKPNEARLKYIKDDKQLVELVKTISKKYDINPKIVLNRISHESFIDNIIKARASKTKSGIKDSTFINENGNVISSAIKAKNIDLKYNFGADFIDDELAGKSEFKLNFEKPIQIFKNDKGNTTAYNIEDAITILTASLKSRQDKVKELYPDKINDKNFIDGMTVKAYNFGVKSATRHQRSNPNFYKDHTLNLFDSVITDENTKSMGGKIEIKKENKGKFSAAAKRAGYTTQEYASKILKNKEAYSPTIVKRANFARNAANWNKKKLGIGGDASYGSEYKGSDISNSEVGATGNTLISAGKGALTGAGAGLALGATTGIGAGAAAGAAAGSIVPGIGTIIGGAIGLIGGLIGGIFGNRKRKRELARIKEQQRQQTIGNMETRMENDYYTMNNSDFNDYSEGQGYYAKYGGNVKRKYALGGISGLVKLFPNSAIYKRANAEYQSILTNMDNRENQDLTTLAQNNTTAINESNPQMATGGLVRNSNNTRVAYGPTHEQIDPTTGQPGIQYGDAEIEGGGINGNSAYAGEVVRETPEVSEVFSNRLVMPGMNKTFAEGAKILTDKKGRKEKQVFDLGAALTEALNVYDKTRMSVDKQGSAMRKLEKLSTKLNKATGEVAELENKTEQLYDAQEQYAGVLGLRAPEIIAACGGTIRRRKDWGGAIALGNFGLNMLNALGNANSIKYTSNIPVPKRARQETPVYNTKYDITSQLSELDSQSRNAKEFISKNVSDPTIARSIMANLAIKTGRAKNQVRDNKEKIQSQLYDRNIEARRQTSAANSQIDYENALAEYNKLTNMESMRAANRTQFLQSTAGLLGDITDWKMQQFAMGAQGLLSASPEDTKRINQLYTSIFGGKSRVPKDSKSINLSIKRQGIALPASLRGGIKLPDSLLGLK